MRYGALVSVSQSLLLAFALLLVTSPAPLRAESMLADLSDRAIRITSNFTGSRIVVFGMIQRDGLTVSRAEPYDLVIVVRGKDETLVSRKKERVAGIWINNKSHVYENAPNFYALASNRKLEDIAHQSVLTKLQLGTNTLLLPDTFKPGDPLPTYDTFREAALRLRREEGLYRDDFSTIVFLEDSDLFRATVDIPANVAVGTYDVSLYLFRGGSLLHSKTQPMTVSKFGFEQITYSLAINHGFVYGLLSVLIALATGWFAGVVFRKN